MRAIITGGTGAIGENFARHLLAGGHEVIILSRDPVATAHRIPQGALGIQWDGHSGAGWWDWIDSDTAIINLAGRNPAHWRWTDTHKRLVLESRIDAGKAVIDAVARAGQPPRVLLQASAVGYYGSRGDEVLTEASAPGHGFRAEVCQVWEQVVTPLKLRTAILRIGIVLSRRGGALAPFVAATRLFGSQLGRGDQYLPWIHNDDVAAAMQHLMLDPTAEGIFNLCVPQPPTNRDFMRATSRALSVPGGLPVPGWALRLALGEQAETVLDSQRVVPQALLAAGFTFAYTDAEAAVRQLITEN